MDSLEWSAVSRSADETRAIGQSIGKAVEAGTLILLIGQLGAGKTTLTQGIATGLGVTAYTKSPSFVLVNEYEGRLPLFHMDLYRIDDPAEAWELGLDDYLGRDGVLAIEWADRATSIFPADRLEIHIDYLSDSERRLTLTANGPVSARAMSALSPHSGERRNPSGNPSASGTALG